MSHSACNTASVLAHAHTTATTLASPGERQSWRVEKQRTFTAAKFYCMYVLADGKSK